MNMKVGIEYFNELYSDDELNSIKAKAFDEIAQMFYNRNFGSATKSEFELLMFSILMDGMIHKYVDSITGILDYKACSDHKIGEVLGITQEKVRSLKVKKQARYPMEFDWKNSLRSIQNRIRYDNEKKKIMIPITDPNLYNEIRNFIEENGGYIEIQRGQNCLQMRPEYLFILLYQGDNENEKKKVREEFAKKLRMKNEAENIDNILTDEELSARALELGDDAFEFLVDLAESVSSPLVGMIKGIQLIGKFAKKKMGNT